jgi:hypothetical protein
MPKEWTTLGDQQKVDVLTNVLTKLGSNLKFRDECMVSPTSALAAILREEDVNFPAGMTIKFMTEEEMKRWIVLKMPEYRDPAGGVITVPADKTYWPCTYTIYNPKTGEL